LSSNIVQLGAAARLKTPMSQSEYEDFSEEADDMGFNIGAGYINETIDMIFIREESFDIFEQFHEHDITGVFASARESLIEMVEHFKLDADLDDIRDFMDMYYNGADDTMSYASWENFGTGKGAL